MAIPQKAGKVKLLIGVLFSETKLLNSAEAALTEKFGEIDYRSPIFPFDLTDFYQAEMGENLKRIFYSFAELIDPAEIAEIKHLTNQIEAELCPAGQRKINLDPGYLDYFKLVLASFKFGGEKVYLGRGVYADITLWYEKGKFKPFIWGFPDFKTGCYNETLLKIRELYKKAISHKGTGKV